MRSNRPLRIVIYDPSGRGGVCHYTYQLAESLAALRLNVTVATSEGYELNHLEREFKLKILFKKSRIKMLTSIVINGLWSSILPVRDKRNEHNPVHQTVSQNDDKWIRIIDFLKVIRLRLLLFKAALSFLFDRPDVIHIQWLIERNEDCKFINLLKLLGFTIVYTAHDLLPNVSHSHNDRKAFEQIYHKVDAIIVHGEDSKNEIVRVFNLDRGKVHVIPHGSNDVFYTGEKISKEAAKEELGISPGRKVVLFFGIIKRYKGLEYLVEAFEEVKAQVDNAMLLVVGRIYDADAEGFRYYSDLIDQIRGRDDVICVPEYIPFEKIGLYFSAADVVVLPYTKTYTSGVLLAAYAAGRPAVVTDTGALSEVVESGKSGFVVPPRDSKALTLAITEVFNRSNIEEMGKYAKHLAETKYSWESVASRTTDLYRALTK